MAQERYDVDLVMDAVRERVRRRREQGLYNAELEETLRAPLPGGALFSDNLADPFAALDDAVEAPLTYDPRSQRPVVGPFITFARRAAIWLLRWWVQDILDRQDRIDRLLARAVQRLNEEPSARFGARLQRLEEQWRRRTGDEVAAQMRLAPFAERFSGDPTVIRAQAEPFVPLFAGRQRILDLGSGRGVFLQLMRDEGIGAYGVDVDRSMVETCATRGFEVYRAEAEEHLRSLTDRSLDGVHAAHFAEHLEPGTLIEVLRQCRRVLKPGSPIVMATPNPRTLGVGAHTFWLDPSHRRPIPPDLFQFYLESEGFIDVEVTSYARTEKRLREDVPGERERENVRLLNETIFGDRDYAVTGRAP